MTKRSAGILMWRRGRDGGVVVLLALPGGPYARRQGDGAWQIPKGGIEPGEDALAAALREFTEETGFRPSGQPMSLGTIRQKAGKLVDAFAVEGEFDLAALVSNEFEMEWPPRSGRMQSFPEIARAGWFELEEARTKMLESQIPLLDRLTDLIGSDAAS